ncbi:MAG TPA: isochorismatase family cysteine hydrolase [Gaiellaceae bacterium]
MRIDPRTTALLVVDLQNDTVGEQGAFADSGAPAFAREHGVIENVMRLVEACRAAELQVIHVWHVDELGHRDSTRNADLFRGIAAADALVRGTWGVQPVPGLEPHDRDMVVEKQRMSSFNCTTLDTKLRVLGATTVIVCGAWTNWAIEHTCRDAADHGYETIVVTDGTATISEEFQRAALDYALTTVATRATVDEVIAAL